MGQAKQRGTKEERVAQAVQRKREELDYAEATKRAHARMAAANERQRVRAERDDVRVLLMGTLAGLGGGVVGTRRMPR